jgi:hypothetical protein
VINTVKTNIEQRIFITRSDHSFNLVGHKIIAVLVDRDVRTFDLDFFSTTQSECDEYFAELHVILLAVYAAIISTLGLNVNRKHHTNDPYRRCQNADRINPLFNGKFTPTCESCYMTLNKIETIQSKASNAEHKQQCKNIHTKNVEHINVAPLSNYDTIIAAVEVFVKSVAETTHPR